jgi:hypothetical protein
LDYKYCLGGGVFSEAKCVTETCFRHEVSVESHLGNFLLSRGKRLKIVEMNLGVCKKPPVWGVEHME